MVHGKRDLVEACLSCLDHAMECVVHGCDVLNKIRGFAREYACPLRAVGAHPSI